MRIIGGIAGGTGLACPKGGRVRPTSDRVKESFFASLGDIRGWRVVDLFAGTGSLGLEALSRGAGSVAFVERDARSLAAARRNVDDVRTRFADQLSDVDVRLIRADVRRVPQLLQAWSGTVDLLLADPPYRPDRGEWGAADLVSDRQIALWAGEALLALEHDVRAALAWHPRAAWKLVKQRRFGSTMVSFARTAAERGR